MVSLMDHKSQTDEKPGTATPLRRYQRLSKHQRAQFPGGPWGGEFVTLRVAVGKVGMDVPSNKELSPSD